MTSLRSRLSIGLAASLIVLLALQWSIASLVIEQLVERQLVSRLTQDAENLLSGIDFNALRELVLDEGQISAVYQRPFSGHYYEIHAPGQIISSRSLWDKQLQIPQVAPGQQVLLRRQGPEQQPLLIAISAYQKQGRLLTIAVAEDLRDVNAGIQRFRQIHGAISCMILFALLGLQYFIVTRSLKPLHKIRTDMQRLEAGEIQSIEARNAPLEIAPLILELNRLLSAMGRKTLRSREAMGNLAHALKTQLALLGQAAERSRGPHSPELHLILRDIGESMRRIIERELKRARLLGAALPGKRLDLRQEVSLLVQTLQMMYADKAIDIEWRVADGSRYGGDQEDMLELLGNLLDNACKWCQQRVRLDIGGNGALALTVEDDGPGCQPDEFEELTRRGFRLDESKPGSGLGLAIVKDIVESYGGVISFTSSPDLRGLRVEVRLPEVLAE